MQKIFSTPCLLCKQCNANQLRQEDRDGQPVIACLACGYSEVIPDFRGDAMAKLRYIRTYQNVNPELNIIHTNQPQHEQI